LSFAANPSLTALGFTGDKRPFQNCFQWGCFQFCAVSHRDITMGFSRAGQQMLRGRAARKYRRSDLIPGTS
jgi:hypothetical protein